MILDGHSTVEKISPEVASKPPYRGAASELGFRDLGVQILRVSALNTASSCSTEMESGLIVSDALDNLRLPSAVPSTANFFTLLLVSKEKILPTAIP
ncbi:MAG: hypothetical protein DME97_05305 [Verrucomicrobia bacterium]|nr:MAG: hypothetical protein DME97_05305 [Verrucomicrobiota bacterium]